MKAEDLISLILDDDKLKKGKLFGEKIYRDEPILKTGAALAKERTPDRISEMRQIAYSFDAMWKTEEWLFYRQGKFMEEFDCEFVCENVRPLSRPTYKLLTTEELRGYFTWRGMIRRGEQAPLHDTYVLLYAYELINIIGAKDPREAFDKLFALYGLCSETKVAARLSDMLSDMPAYYRLPHETCSRLPVKEVDSALLSIIHSDTADDDALFAAAVRFSDHKLESSAAYKKHPDDFKAAVSAVMRAFTAHYEGSDPFHVQLFGMMLSRWHMPFRGAVLFPRGDLLQSFEYEVSEARKYICTKGIWQLQCYLCTRSKRLGAIMKSADRLLRQRLGIKCTLKRGDISEEDEAVLTAAVNEYFEQKARAAMPKIEIDVSKLGEIRRISEITRDRLIVEEETEDEPAPLPIKPEEPVCADNTPADVCSGEADLPLTESEKTFLRTLLYGGDIRAAAAGSMPSLLADSINDKLYDMFGDTVIGFDGDEPAVIEDYTDELKGKIPQ